MGVPFASLNPGLSTRGTIALSPFLWSDRTFGGPSTWDLCPLEDFAQVAARDIVAVERFPVWLGKDQGIFRCFAACLLKRLVE